MDEETTMYTGIIINDGEIKDVDRIITNGKGQTLDLEASLKVYPHSPTGFCWGYGGSGPAQLALAILMDVFNGDDARALSMHQEFKDMVIARLPMDEGFVLTDQQVESAISIIDIRRMKRL
jgi:Family of unknown function (DUF6166)